MTADGGDVDWKLLGLCLPYYVKLDFMNKTSLILFISTQLLQTTAAALWKLACRIYFSRDVN